MFACTCLHARTEKYISNRGGKRKKSLQSELFIRSLMCCSVNSANVSMYEGGGCERRRRAQLTSSWTQYLCNGNRFPHKIQTEPLLAGDPFDMRTGLIPVALAAAMSSSSQPGALSLTFDSYWPCV